MGTVPAALHDLALYVLVVLAFLGPVEAFLRFRLRQAAHRADGHAYLALSDPWVTVIVALAGTAATALVGALS
jgi:hypothetical protein